MKTINEILLELEKLLWEREAREIGLKHGFDIPSLMAVTKIFSAAILEISWKYQEDQKMPFEWRGKQAELTGQKIRQLIIDTCNIDTHEFHRKEFKNLETKIKENLDNLK